MRCCCSHFRVHRQYFVDMDETIAQKEMEGLITDLRKELKVSNEELRNKGRQMGCNLTLYSPTACASHKKQKTSYSGSSSTSGPPAAIIISLNIGSGSGEGSHNL
ncbi:hypothetical protein E3N88_40317 [Mikania micrantha]|uniref:Uncharacterized protein n=1 Tax=Mikania micrantha TaxID=192012 RepID=A0A5N6LM87_9ASTR|nr:hypothetical protein E3N88_40317 [Mikania micrantha]